MLQYTGNSQSIAWTRPHIEALCDQLREKLEGWAAKTAADGDSRSAAKLLDQARDDVGKLEGTLQLLGTEGGALLGGAVSGAVDALAGEPGEQADDLLALLLEAIAVLPHYLDRLEVGDNEISVILLPLINDLQAAAGASTLSDSALFAPDLARVEPPRVDGHDLDLDALRSRFEQALLAWLKKPGGEAGESALGDAIGQLAHGFADRPDLRRLGAIGKAAVSGLAAGVIRPRAALKRLFMRVDLLLKRLQSGEENISADEVDALSRGFLFHVALAERGHADTDAVAEAYRLQDLLPDRVELEQARSTVAGRNRSVFVSVAKAVKEELGAIKDELDLHLRGEDTPPDHLRDISEMLASLGETVSMLGLNRVAGRIHALTGRLEHLTEDPDDPELLDAARELLLVESGLEDSIHYLGEAPEFEDEEESPVTLLPPAERARVMRQLLSEASIDLHQGKHLLDALNRGESDAGAAADAMKLLNRIAGALLMAGLEDAARLAAANAAFVKKELVDTEEPADALRMNHLAEALTGLEFYLESLERVDAQGLKFLQSARDRLSELGYWESEGAAADETPEAVESRVQDPELLEIDAGEAEAPAHSADAETSEPSPDADFDLASVFLEEFDAEHAAIEDQLQRWRADPEDRESLTSIRRTFHTLKGSGRMTGAAEIGEFAWAVENMLNQVIDGKLPADEALPVVAEACAALPGLRARFLGESTDLDEQVLTDIVDRSAHLARREPEAAAAPEPAATADEPTETPAAGDGDGDGEEEGPDPTLVKLMINELTEHLAVLESWLTEAQLRGWTSPVDEPLVRSVHTMKGTLRLAPIADEADAAEAAENYLQELSEHHETPDGRGLELLRGVEKLFRLRLRHLAGEPLDEGRFQSADLTAGISGHLHELRETATRRGDYLPPSVPGEDVFAFDAADTEAFETGDTDQTDAEEFAPPALAEPEEAAAPDEAIESGQTTVAAPSFSGMEPTGSGEAAESAGFGNETAAGDDFAVPEPDAPKDVHIDYTSLDSELVGIFLEESNDLLEHTDDLLHGWRDNLADRGTVTALQRNLHTVKGSARMAGLDPVGELAHAMEEVLEGVADGSAEPSTETVDALELGCDRLHAMLKAVSAEKDLPAVDLSLITAAAEDISPPLQTAAADGPAADARQSADQARGDTLRINAGLLDNLVNFAGEISIFRSRLEQQVNLFQQNVGEVDSTVIRLREQLRKMEIETEAQILARYEREHGPTSDFDPLELDRYSTIQQLSRSLAESVADLTSLAELLDEAARQSETLLMQQSRVNTELQEGLMQARLVAFATLAPRLRRVVRNAARDTGKQAQLMIDLRGESQLDRNVLERVAAPLEHMLRNAVAHGIEPPERRAKAGKPEIGTITIEVDREATELVIRVIDDGAGLDVKAIRDTAVKRGLLRKDSQVSDDQAARLIFEPGFTTAGEISELAGRGVGMDVAASEVRQIGGGINVHTETGRGTRFSIRIPLTLAVMQAILLRAEDRTFAVPLQVVRGVARVPASEYENAIAEPEPVYEYGGESYPLLELEPQLGLQSDEIAGGTLSLVMIQAGEQRAAIRVSELIGHREIVVKPVGPQVSSIPGILGGTISADGQVVLILDLGPLIQRALHESAPVAAPAEAPSQSEVKRAPLVMVVDDSITMRRITSRVLEQHDLEVITAKDGLDAVEILHDRIPDVMLLDIEMPRMDGFELAGHVRADSRLRHIPMMMITSRTGDKHRRRAGEIGVNRYLSKPYQESELVKNVFEMLKAAGD